jgi:predicted phosphodiesterase
MRIQYASDLHLEFRENSSFLKHNPLAVAGEVLVLAGDIGYIGDENYSRHPFWDWASGNYSRVIVVPGNHEFYKMFDIDKLYNNNSHHPSKWLTDLTGHHQPEWG